AEQEPKPFRHRPALSDFVRPARAKQLSYAKGTAHDDGDQKQAEARIDPIKRQIEHWRVLPPEELDIAERAWKRPQEDAADQSEARQRCDASAPRRKQPIDEVERDLILVANNEGLGPEDDPDEQDHQHFVGPDRLVVFEVAREDLVVED